MLPFCDMFLPKCPKVAYGYVGTCGFETIKFILTHICPCFFNFGSNKVEKESESTTLLSEIAVKTVKPSFYEHRSTLLLINLSCTLNKTWILLSGVWKLQNDVRREEPLRAVTCTGSPRRKNNSNFSK